MEGWVFILGIGGTCLLCLIIKWLYFDPAERSYKARVRKCMDGQARKRHGAVKVTHGRPTLTIPYKDVNIDLSLVENNDEIYREYTYARFRTEFFDDKDFKIILDSKDLLLKPLVVGTRLKVL